VCISSVNLFHSQIPRKNSPIVTKNVILEICPCNEFTGETLTSLDIDNYKKVKDLLNVLHPFVIMRESRRANQSNESCFKNPRLHIAVRLAVKEFPKSFPKSYISLDNF